MARGNGNRWVPKARSTVAMQGYPNLDEQMNGAYADPNYWGAMPISGGEYAAVAGHPSTPPDAPAQVAAQSEGLGRAGLYLWGAMLVLLVISHTFTFEIQE
jgi:hypothetical protein